MCLSVAILVVGSLSFLTGGAGLVAGVLVGSIMGMSAGALVSVLAANEHFLNSTYEKNQREANKPTYIDKAKTEMVVNFEAKVNNYSPKFFAEEPIESMDESTEIGLTKQK